MIHRGDSDCHYFSVEVSDEEIAYRLAKTHTDWCDACEPEDIEWQVRRG